jgi:hypothetical protein
MHEYDTNGDTGTDIDVLPGQLSKMLSVISLYTVLSFLSFYFMFSLKTVAHLADKMNTIRNCATGVNVSGNLTTDMVLCGIPGTSRQ